MDPGHEVRRLLFSLYVALAVEDICLYFKLLISVVSKMIIDIKPPHTVSFKIIIWQLSKVSMINNLQYVFII
jgi:hypothetical protein